MFQRFFKLDEGNRVVSVREGHYELDDKHADEIIIHSANHKEFKNYMHCIFVNGQLVEDGVTISKRKDDEEFYKKQIMMQLPQSQE